MGSRGAEGVQMAALQGFENEAMQEQTWYMQ